MPFQQGEGWGRIIIIFSSEIIPSTGGKWKLFYCQLFSDLELLSYHSPGWIRLCFTFHGLFHFTLNIKVTASFKKALFICWSGTICSSILSCQPWAVLSYGNKVSEELCWGRVHKDRWCLFPPHTAIHGAIRSDTWVPPLGTWWLCRETLWSNPFSWVLWRWLNLEGEIKTKQSLTEWYD